MEGEVRSLCGAAQEAYVRERDPVHAADAALSRFLEESLDPGIQRIAFIDAPSVLGSPRMREIDAKYGLALVRTAVERVIAAASASGRDVDMLTHLFFGSLHEGAMFVARTDDPRDAKQQVERELRGVLHALAA